MDNAKSKINEELELLREYLNETQKTVFNMPEDKVKKIIGDIFNCSKYKLDEVASYLYEPQNITGDYKPKIRGYIRVSEDWELKKNDIEGIVISLKKLKVDKIYSDSKNDNHTNLYKLINDLKTGDTLMIIDISQLVSTDIQLLALISYLKNNKIKISLNGYTFTFEKGDIVGAYEDGLLDIIAMHQVNQRNFYFKLFNDYKI